MLDRSYLSRLRRFRGSDEAVEIIGNRDGLIDLLTNSKSVSRDEIMNAVMSAYAGNNYGDVNWPKFSGGWTTPQEPTLYGMVREQYPEASQLSLDPGFVTHLPEFVTFLRSANLGTQNYSTLRAAFKEYLGYKMMWRGMVVTEEQAERIKREGIPSLFLNANAEVPLSIENFEATVLSVYFSDLVEVHFHGENPYSPLVSVSSHEDVAIVMGKHFGKKPKSPERELYLFQIRVPEIDIIYYTSHAVKRPTKLATLGDGRERQLSISLNGKSATYPWDRHVESYVLYKIDSHEIVEITKPEITTFSWRG